MNSIIRKALAEFKVEGSLANVEFLRDAVNFLDHRLESQNENKSIVRLLTEYAKSVNRQGR